LVLNVSLIFAKFIDEGEIMKTRNTLSKLVTITMALAACLLVGAGWLERVEAQTSEENVRLVSYETIGIVEGQRIRLTVGSTEQSAGTARLSFSYYLAHGTNATSRIPVYESEWIPVQPGEFRFFDLVRKDLNVEGEPRTGRVQVIIRATIIAPAGSKPANFPGALEVINELTGATTVLSSNRIWEYTPCCDPSY
jgi:hypothetical protein